MGRRIDQFCNDLRQKLTMTECGLDGLMMKIDTKAAHAERYVQSHLDRTRKRIEQGRAKVAAAQANMKNWVENGRTIAEVTEWKAKRDFSKLQRRADYAERCATAAIDVAVAAVDEAEQASLEAWLARDDANVARDKRTRRPVNVVRPSDPIDERRCAKDLRRRQTEQQALLLQVTSDLIRASEPGELARTTFKHVSSALEAAVCLSYLVDPKARRLRLAFEQGVPPEDVAEVQSIELGKGYCGTVAASRQPVVADKQRIAFDPVGAFVRGFGATAYAGFPLKASDGRLLGTFAVVSVTRDRFTEDEVIWLGMITNFLTQAWERFEAERSLRASEERFRSSILHSPLPMALFDDQEQTLVISQSWLEGSGYSEDELRSISDWAARAYGERSAEALEGIRRSVWTEPAQAAEMMIRTKDGGERFWSLVCSALEPQSEGRRQFICVAQDITERETHEKRVHLLMREIDHRAKNMLSVVQAIACQTAACGPEAFIERFTERIQALAANQDMLIQNGWQGVDAQNLVRVQLAHFADLLGTRITAHGPKLRLSAAAGQAIGLALHELATNAGKYGALSTDAGRVDVTWQLDGDIFVMSWAERNGPPVSPPERRGFGSTVVDSMAKLSVGGEVQFDYPSSGVVWRLTCPAANALEPRDALFWGKDHCRAGPGA